MCSGLKIDICSATHRVILHTLYDIVIVNGIVFNLERLGHLFVAFRRWQVFCESIKMNFHIEMGCWSQ